MKSLRSFHLARRAILTTTIAVVLFPYLVMGVTLFKPDDELTASQRWLPQSFSLDELIAAATDGQVWTYITNSFIIATGVTLVVLFCAIPAAYVLARHQFRGRTQFMDVILITQMVSPVVLIVALFQMFSALDLLSSYSSVIIASSAFVLPFSVWLLVGFFSSISNEIEEAAVLDGCSRFRIMTAFVVPISRPGIAATALYAFIYGWNEFIFSLTFLSGAPDRWPVTIGVFSNAGQWFVSWQPLMFMALMGSIPILLLFAVLQRQFDAGFASFASK